MSKFDLFMVPSNAAYRSPHQIHAQDAAPCKQCKYADYLLYQPWHPSKEKNLAAKASFDSQTNSYDEEDSQTSFSTSVSLNSAHCLSTSDSCCRVSFNDQEGISTRLFQGNCRQLFRYLPLVDLLRCLYISFRLIPLACNHQK